MPFIGMMNLPVTVLGAIKSRQAHLGEVESKWAEKDERTSALLRYIQILVIRIIAIFDVGGQIEREGHI
jgi:hypothetical protein